MESSIFEPRKSYLNYWLSTDDETKEKYYALSQSYLVREKMYYNEREYIREHYMDKEDFDRQYDIIFNIDWYIKQSQAKLQRLIENIVLPNGKHAGNTLYQIHNKRDFQYIIWFINNYQFPRYSFHGTIMNKRIEQLKEELLNNVNIHTNSFYYELCKLFRESLTGTQKEQNQP